MRVVEYNDDQHFGEWNDFVARCKNAPFFANAAFFQYHNVFRPSRFVYQSFMFYDEKDQLLAVMPGNVEMMSGTYYSHGGLSFGGVLSTSKMTTPKMLEVFDCLVARLRRDRLDRMIYKPPPYIYHAIPADEDLYALHLHGAYLLRRNPSTVINLRAQDRPVSKLRKRGLDKALASGIETQYASADEGLVDFWQILCQNLWERHEVYPAHSYEEIKYLMDLFPSEIELCVAWSGESVVAGVMTFRSPAVTRLQYIASTEWGRSNGAVDACVFCMIEQAELRDTQWFDFGVSTETKYVGNRLVLNLGLVFQKEGFGGRTVLYDTYALEVTDGS